MSAVVAALAVAACSGGDDNGTEPTPTIDLTLASATLSVVQGASGTVGVTVTRAGGYTGAVTVDVEGEPTGVTVTPVTIASGSTTGTLTIAAAGTAAAGNSTLTVRATGTGVTDKTSTLTLTITAAPAQSYTIAVGSPTSTVAQGANTTQTITVTRTGGFAGAVDLSVSGLPNGVTGAFNPTSVPGAGTTSTLTLTASPTATVGQATVTVTGTSGQTTRTATFTLTVTATQTGAFTIAVAPTTVTVQQGTNTTTATVTVARTGGFAGAVDLAISGLPNGVTGAFNPQSVPGGSTTSTLTLTATPTATVGQATATITATGTGVANQTATLTVNVTQATGGSGNTVWDFCSTSDTPVWLAVQDGSGAWTRVTGTGARFQFNIASGRGGVAFVHAVSSGMVSERRTVAKRMSGMIETTMLLRNKAVEMRASRRYAAQVSRSMVDGFELSIFYGTQAELNAQGTGQCFAGSGKTVNGTVAGLTPPQQADISLGDAGTTVESGTTFTLTDVPDGALDLIASRSVTSQTLETTVDKIIIRRNVNAANNSTLPVLDFNAAEAFAPAQANITVGNLGGDAALVTTAFVTGTTGINGAGLFSGFALGAGPFKYYGVPTAQQAANDLHLALVLAAPDEFTGRFTGLFFKAPTDRTVTLGDHLPTQTISAAATTPYVRFRATGSLTAAYNKFVEILFTQSTASVYRFVSIGATAGYLNNATTYDLTVPDFSGVAGWDNNWGPKAGVATEWTVTGAGFTGIGIISPNPVEGSTFQAAFRSSTFTP